jgi:hypothetical protein
MQKVMVPAQALWCPTLEWATDEWVAARHDYAELSVLSAAWLASTPPYGKRGSTLVLRTLGTGRL